MILGAGYSRAALSEALGNDVLSRISDCGRGRVSSYHWRCGCIAREVSDATLTVFACPVHEGLLVSLSRAEPSPLVGPDVPLANERPAFWLGLP